MLRTRQGAEKLLAAIQDWVGSDGLVLHPEKTHV